MRNAALDPSVEVEDRRREEPELQDVGEDVLDVAKVDGEGGDEERKPQREDELHEDRQGQEQGPRAELPLDDEEDEEDGEAEEEVHEVREDGHRGKDLRGKEDLLDEVAAGDQDPGGLGDRRLEPGPRQDPAEEEEEVGLHLGRAADGKHLREDETVGEEQEQRVDEAPEEPEHAPPVARLQLAGDEALDQQAVAKEVADLREHQLDIVPATVGDHKDGFCAERVVRVTGQARCLWATARRVTALM